MIYLWQHPVFTKEEMEWGKALLSDQRREKIAALRFEKNREQSMAAYLLLRYALYTEYGIVQKPYFCFPSGTKPALCGKDFSGLHMNISHCDIGCACALSRFPVGIDVQTVTPFREKVARYAFSPQEQLLQSPDAFTRIFTLKEAFGKHSGKGIAYSMRLCDFSSIEGDWQQRDGVWWYSVGDGQWHVSVCAEEKLAVKKVPHTRIMEVLRQIGPESGDRTREKGREDE